MEELWKDIEGYEWFYQISNLGNVKSLNYRNHGYAKNLVPKVNNSGRLWVELIKHGKKKPMLIHRLVAMAFIDNPNNYPQINHKDENPKNNVVSNLEWCTKEYNIQYTLDRHPGERNKVKYYSERYRKMEGVKVDQIAATGEVVKTWADVRTIYKETGMNDWSIAECCRGNRKTAYGFKWQYAI